MSAEANLSLADLKRDPSLLGVFGMCLRFVPIQLACYLLGTALAAVLPLSRGPASLLPLTLMAAAGLPLWIWLMYCYFHRNWRDQAWGG